MAFKRPGVYMNENLLPSAINTSSSESVETIMGPLQRGPLTVTPVTSWQMFKKLYGNFVVGADNTTAIQAFFFFLNGGATLYVLRLVGAGAAAATRIFKDSAGTPANALTVNAKNPGTWGNQVFLEVVAGSSDAVRTLFVRIVPTGAAISDSQIVERWQDVSLDPTSSRYVVTMLNDLITGSNYLSTAIVNGYTFATGAVLGLSAVPGGDALTGGANGSALTLGANGEYGEGLPVLDTITQPFVLNMPDVTDTATVDAALAYADPALGGRGDVFVVIDCQPGRTPDQVATDLAAFTASSYGALYYPRLVVPDPTITTRGATITIPPGGSMLGQYAHTDATRGVQKSPAGINNVLANVLDIERQLSNSDLDALNLAGVNAIRPQPGTGICAFGARTLVPTPSSMYISIRRTLIAIKSSLLNGTMFAVFEPNDSTLWGHLTTVCENILNQYFVQGALAGATPDEAYYVVCDDTNNTTDTVAQGVTNIEIGVAPEYPAEFVVISIGQFDGGNTVTESPAVA